MLLALLQPAQERSAHAEPGFFCAHLRTGQGCSGCRGKPTANTLSSHQLTFEVVHWFRLRHPPSCPGRHWGLPDRFAGRRRLLLECTTRCWLEDCLCSRTSSIWYCTGVIWRPYQTTHPMGKYHVADDFHGNTDAILPYRLLARFRPLLS